MKKYRAGLIGYGGIGRSWAKTFAGDAKGRWDLACICDIDETKLAEACLATTADARPPLLRRALAAGKHIIAEKPIASNLDDEDRLLEDIEASDRLVGVNLFNRNAWYHKEAIEFIASGQIGKLGIVRLCHMTAGRMPGVGHHAEGPTFRDCGMHYVDVARWIAASEYDRWDAQAVRMWGEDEPWWVSVHGTFVNGVAFEITQGFVYGQLAEHKINNSYCECIGTKGVTRSRHNFANSTLEMHGTSRTVEKTAPYGGKKMDVMIDLLARSIDAGKNLGLPSARDSVIASRVSQQMHDDAKAAGPPTIGTPEVMQEIIQHKQRH